MQHEVRRHFEQRSHSRMLLSEMPEFRALRGLQFYLSPFEAQRFAEPQACIEKQQNRGANSFSVGTGFRSLIPTSPFAN
jgi:hypothetical protein